MHVAAAIKQETLPVVMSQFAIAFALCQIYLSNFTGTKLRSVEPVGT